MACIGVRVERRVRLGRAVEGVVNTEASCLIDSEPAVCRAISQRAIDCLAL